MPEESIAVGIERIQTRLVKRREGEAEPYEIIETDTFYDKDGNEVATSTTTDKGD